MESVKPTVTVVKSNNLLSITVSTALNTNSWLGVKLCQLLQLVDVKVHLGELCRKLLE